MKKMYMQQPACNRLLLLLLLLFILSLIRLPAKKEIGLSGMEEETTADRGQLEIYPVKVSHLMKVVASPTATDSIDLGLRLIEE